MTHRVLITGNAGYIGSYLSRMLMKDPDLHVTGLDKVRPQIQVHTQYITDITQPFVIQPEFDTVIHLAALVNVSDSQRNPVDYYTTNLIGTMNVLNFIDSKNFVFASTGAAEGCASSYGISKRAAEDVVWELCKKRGLDFTTFRFYNVVGYDGIFPTNPDGLMYNLMKAMKTGSFTIFGKDYEESSDGTCIRDYVHVNEICNALKLAILNPSNKVECLGHGVGHTVKEMVNIFKEVNKCDFAVSYGPRRAGDLASSVLEDVSPYMIQKYSISDLMHVDIKQKQVYT
jgi:UDP-glucose 4-epimerase